MRSDRLQPYLKANELMGSCADLAPESLIDNMPGCVDRGEMKRILEHKLKGARSSKLVARRGHQSAPPQMETIRELSYEDNAESESELTASQPLIQIAKLPSPAKSERKESPPLAQTVSVVSIDPGTMSAPLPAISARPADPSKQEGSLSGNSSGRAGLEGTTKVKEGPNGLGPQLSEILENMKPGTMEKRSADPSPPITGTGREEDSLEMVGKGWNERQHSKRLSEEMQRQGLFAGNPSSAQLMQLLVGTISQIEAELANNFEGFTKKFVTLADELSSHKRDVHLLSDITPLKIDHSDAKHSRGRSEKTN